MFFFELKQICSDQKARLLVDTIDCFSYIKPALQPKAVRLKTCGKAVSMRDYYSSCVSTDHQPSLYYLAQFLSNQSNRSSDLAPDPEALGTEPRARRTATAVDDGAQ